MPLSPTEVDRLARLFEAACDSGGTLRNRLATYAAANREILPRYGEAVDRLVARLTTAGSGSRSPQIGDVLPPFVLPDENGHLVSLASLLAYGPVAVMLFRGHWCPYCRLNLQALVEAQATIRERGGQIIAIMPETQTYSARWKSRSGAVFPILTDLDNGYALSLDLLIWLGREIVDMQVLADLSTFNSSNGEMLPIPATFVLGRDGVVTARFVDPDFRRRMEIDDLIAAIERAR